jgi:hypothetical protein
MGENYKTFDHLNLELETTDTVFVTFLTTMVVNYFHYQGNDIKFHLQLYAIQNFY